MKRIAAALVLLAVGLTSLWLFVPRRERTEPFTQQLVHDRCSLLPVWHPEYHTAFAVTEAGRAPEADELEGVQSPIPMADRVRNHTGIQCVFASLECLGRWADIKALTEPPLTSRAECKSFSGPSDAASKLHWLGVRFDMSYRDRGAGIALIKKAMADGRGCLWGVPGHAMVLVHYDEDKGVVKYVNNSNSRLPVQTMAMGEFRRRWDSWVMTVYNDPDPFPAKAGRADWANLIPVIDRNGPQGHYENYIPKPGR